MVALHGNLSFRGVQLAEILARADVATRSLLDQPEFGRQMEAADRLPDALVVSIDRPVEGRNGLLRDVRAVQRRFEIPVLGVAMLSRLGIAPDVLRGYGFAGVIDPRTRPTDVLARVLRQMGLPTCDLGSHERASCVFPVELSLGRSRFVREFSINLSATGMRLTSTLPIDVNRDIRLRFELPSVAHGAIGVEARVVHRITFRNSQGCWEIGVFFKGLEDADREAIARYVESLLLREQHHSRAAVGCR